MPGSHRELFPPVDEKKALEQLEKFQREIQSARWKREQASAEFETFVKGFHESPEPEPPSGSPASERPRPSSPSVVRAMRRHTPATLPTRPAEPAVVPRPAPAAPQPTAAARRLPAEPEPAVETPAATAETTSYSTRLQHWRGNALVAAALAAIVLLSIGWWKSAPSSTTLIQSGTTTALRPARAAQPPTPAPPVGSTQPATAAPPVAEHAATVTTKRRVWVRVMADGHRLFERELAAGEVVPIDATQAIVIRAGDAGAVRLTFADGRVETLGAEGQVVTKRFELKR